jgi:hypothetical protein
MAASNTSQVPAFPQDYPTALAIPNDRITATQSAAAAGLDAAVSAPESGERLVIEDQSGLTPRHEFAAVAAKADVEAPSRPIAGAILTDQPTFFVSEWSDNSSLLRTETDLGSPMAPFAFVTSADGSLSARHSAAHFPIPQIVTQLAGALIRNAQGATELALSPEELGRVRLRMEPDAAHPGRMVILISVERPETLELFRRHAGELADAIRAAGYSEADIGFGHEGEDRRPGGQHASAEGAPGRTSDDPDPPPRSARHPAGNNLYLRL